ncbi:MAG: DUF2510 domain-containing protein [Actinobacteria bacterium]|nr:DUF2510 domain-containing protein [Actinomycetota bacterium]
MRLSLNVDLMTRRRRLQRARSFFVVLGQELGGRTAEALAALSDDDDDDRFLSARPAALSIGAGFNGTALDADTEPVQQSTEPTTRSEAPATSEPRPREGHPDSGSLTGHVTADLQSGRGATPDGVADTDPSEQLSTVFGPIDTLPTRTGGGLFARAADLHDRGPSAEDLGELFARPGGEHRAEPEPVTRPAPARAPEPGASRVPESFQTADGAGHGGSSTAVPGTRDQSPPETARARRPVPPGWYADPAGHADLRYWDGRWTAHVVANKRLFLSPLTSPAPPPSPDAGS